MTTAADILLAQLLGECHALWLPLRQPMATYWAAIWELRWHYARRGFPWYAGGSKELARALTALVRAGLVRRCRGREKTIGVILTAKGIRQGGLLAGFGADDAECFTAEVLKHGPAGAWIPEIALNDGKGWGDGRQAELQVVEITALQALSLGYAEANCDVYGRVGYRVTTAGVVAVQAWDGTLSEPAPEGLEAYLEAYQEGFSAGLARLQALPRLDREIGEIPLPVAAWYHAFAGDVATAT
ncbi:hypothetical protein [Thermogutta sp.]|uniref:hypothetical protein n=1 Tax=Thermogutta sp. TaxID=1962930 RepID=UPI00321FB0C2